MALDGAVYLKLQVKKFASVKMKVNPGYDKHRKFEDIGEF